MNQKYYRLLLCFLFFGCASIQTGTPLIKTAGAVATTEILGNIKDSGKRTVAANYVYSVAVGMRTLSGTTPTMADLQATLKTFGAPNDPQIAMLIENLSELYASYYAQLQGDKLKAAALVLEALAEGAEQGAKVYQ